MSNKWAYRYICAVEVIGYSLLAVLILAGCSTTGPGSPPEFRLQPVAYPSIPEPSVPCRHDPARLCNTDEETAGVLAGYDAALGEANRVICWLRVYHHYEACRTE